MREGKGKENKRQVARTYLLTPCIDKDDFELSTLLPPLHKCWVTAIHYLHTAPADSRDEQRPDRILWNRIPGKRKGEEGWCDDLSQTGF